MATFSSKFRIISFALVLCVAGATAATAQRETPDNRSFGDRKIEPRAPDQKAAPRSDAPKSDGKRADTAKEPKPIPRSMRRPGSPAVPEGGAARAALLAELYAYLATATDEDVSKQTASAIEHVWHVAGSDTLHLLLDRATRAAKDKKLPLALKLFERAVQLAPDNPDVFARRAAVFYSENDLDNAMGDLRRVLALDRFHFKALDGLANILKDTGRKKAALEVYRQLYAVHPFYPGAKSAIDELQREVEGQAS